MSQLCTCHIHASQLMAIPFNAGWKSSPVKSTSKKVRHGCNLMSFLFGVLLQATVLSSWSCLTPFHTEGIYAVQSSTNNNKILATM